MGGMGVVPPLASRGKCRVKEKHFTTYRFVIGVRLVHSWAAPPNGLKRTSRKGAQERVRGVWERKYIHIQLELQ